MKRIPRRIFTEKFKKEAVRLVKSEGLTLAEAGRKLEVAPKSLKTWIALQQQGALTGSLSVAKLSAEQLRIRAGTLHHSNRGSQYFSQVYRALQQSYKMQTSMSRKDDCWEFALSRHLSEAQSSHNTPMESFFGTLKNECLHHTNLKQEKTLEK